MSDHPMDIHVGKRLRLRRSTLGMSQEFLGNAIGVTFQQVQKYERGANRIGAGRLFDFSNILQVSVSYFFEGYKQENEASGFAEGDVPEFEYEQLGGKESLALARAYHNISDPAVRKKLLSLVKAMSDKSATSEKESVA